MAPGYYWGVLDGPVIEVTYGTYGTVIGTHGPNVYDDVLASDLLASIEGVTEFLIARGGAASSSVRFSVVTEDEGYPPGSPEYGGAPVWPFGSPPTAFAVSKIEASQLFPSYVAWFEGAEADVARQLRNEALSGAFGVSWKSFIPLVGTDGTRYRFNVRDIGPYETKMGDLVLP